MAAVNRSSVDPLEKSGDSGHKELVPGEVYGFTAGPLALPTHQELFILCAEKKRFWSAGVRGYQGRVHELL